MRIHYYLGWFNDHFPENLVRLLQEDITDRKSLVMISSNPLSYEYDGSTERAWLDQAGIMFDEYHLINYRVKKEDAHTLVQHASVIFLLGGDALKQNYFLKEYELSNGIKSSSAIVMGASAGAINMSAKWLCSKKFGFNVETSAVLDGIGLGDFSVLSHFDLENNFTLVQTELSALSEEMDIYASNKDCAIRIKGDKTDVLGNVYLISHSKVQKLKETL
ncbi:cyanophycinase [Virgibacillus halodenitrificans]|nr:cyanophycinase [Virgibacillus halodenitrificans]